MIPLQCIYQHDTSIRGLLQNAILFIWKDDLGRFQHHDLLPLDMKKEQLLQDTPPLKTESVLNVHNVIVIAVTKRICIAIWQPCDDFSALTPSIKPLLGAWRAWFICIRNEPWTASWSERSGQFEAVEQLPGGGGGTYYVKVMGRLRGIDPTGKKYRF